MNRQSKRTVLPDCKHIDINDPDEAVEQFAIRMGGITYMPATSWEFGDVIDSNDHRLASMFLALPSGIGLHAAMTSVTLRGLAAKMIKVADKIESEAAVQASAVIARAAHPGNRPENRPGAAA